MVKNTIIIVLVLVVAGTAAYIYNLKSEIYSYSSEKVVKPKFFYRVEMITGGRTEGKDVINKADTIDVIAKDGLTFSFDKSQIQKIEKIYYESRKKINVTHNILVKKVNSAK